jgi:hypothetical protein
MKALTLLILPLLLAAWLCACDLDDDDCIRASNTIVTQQLFLPPLQGMELELPAQVTLRQGPLQQIVAEGPQNIVGLLEEDVADGIWTVTIRGCVQNLSQLRIDATLPSCRYLAITGAGNIFSENALLTDQLDMDITGQGQMDVAVEAPRVRARISGAGNYRLEGITDLLEFDLSGNGNLNAFDLDALEADISIVGSGSAEVFARDLLRVNISGQGTVFYRGQPQLDVNISGVGDVIDAN